MIPDVSVVLCVLTLKTFTCQSNVVSLFTASRKSLRYLKSWNEENVLSSFFAVPESIYNRFWWNFSVLFFGERRRRCRGSFLERQNGRFVLIFEAWLIASLKYRYLFFFEKNQNCWWFSKCCTLRISGTFIAIYSSRLAKWIFFLEVVFIYKH